MNVTPMVRAAVIAAVVLAPMLAVAHGRGRLGTVEALRKTKDVKPVYPPNSLEAGDEGTVIIEFRVDESGRVTEATVVFSKCPALNDAAVTAVRAWRFQPTAINGKPTPFAGTAPILFRLPPKLRSRAGRPGACKWVEPPKPMQ